VCVDLRLLQGVRSGSPRRHDHGSGMESIFPITESGHPVPKEAMTSSEVRNGYVSDARNTPG
jgi:hypothetical protein